MKIDNRKLDLQLARQCKTISNLRDVASSQTLTRIWQGDNVKPATLGRIAQALHCDPTDIMEGE